MRLTIGAVGRVRAGPEKELINRYLDRIGATGRGVGITGIKLREFAESRAASAKARRAAEAQALLAALPPSGPLVLLDEAGKSMNSEALAARIGNWRDTGTQDLWFAIGGPDGLDHSLREQARLIVTFSALTWPHQLVRVMLAEQLYRCTSILAGHPYHRGG